MSVPRLQTYFIPADTSVYVPVPIGGMCSVTLQNIGAVTLYLDTNKDGFNAASKTQRMFMLAGFGDANRPQTLTLNAGGPSDYFNDGVVLYVSNSQGSTVGYLSTLMIDKRSDSPY